MNRRTLYVVAMVVVAIHLGIYYLLNHLGGGSRPATKRPPAAKPNFGISQETYSDSQSGEKIHYQEIRVTTQMADSAMVDRILQERAAKAQSAATPGPVDTTPAPPPAELTPQP